MFEMSLCLARFLPSPSVDKHMSDAAVASRHVTGKELCNAKILRECFVQVQSFDSRALRNTPAAYFLVYCNACSGFGILKPWKGQIARRCNFVKVNIKSTGSMVS